MQNKALDTLEEVCNDGGLPICFYFWDETEQGKKKPEEYGVYIIDNEETEVDSNDDEEVLKTEIKFDIFSKSKAFRSNRFRICKALKEKGFFVSFINEMKELDTKYNHTTLNLTYYTEVE